MVPPENDMMGFATLNPSCALMAVGSMDVSLRTRLRLAYLREFRTSFGERAAVCPAPSARPSEKRFCPSQTCATVAALCHVRVWVCMSALERREEIDAPENVSQSRC